MEFDGTYMPLHIRTEEFVVSTVASQESIVSCLKCERRKEILVIIGLFQE